MRRIGLPNIELAHASKLFVTNIPKNITKENIIELFDKYGQLRIVELVKNPVNPAKNHCYIKYTTKEQAIGAVKELSGLYKFPGSAQPVEVVFAEQRRHNKKMFSTITGNTLNNTSVNVSKVNVIPAADTNLLQQLEGSPSGEREVFYEFASEYGPYYYNPVSNVSQWDRPVGLNIIVLPQSEYAPANKDTLETQQSETREDRYAVILFRDVSEMLTNEAFYDLCRNYGNVTNAIIASDEMIAQIGIQRSHPSEKIGLVYFEDINYAQGFYNMLHGNTLGGDLNRQDRQPSDLETIVNLALANCAWHSYNYGELLKMRGQFLMRDELIIVDEDCLRLLREHRRRDVVPDLAEVPILDDHPHRLLIAFYKSACGDHLGDEEPYALLSTEGAESRVGDSGHGSEHDGRIDRHFPIRKVTVLDTKRERWN